MVEAQVLGAILANERKTYITGLVTMRKLQHACTSCTLR